MLPGFAIERFKETNVALRAWDTDCKIQIYGIKQRGIKTHNLLGNWESNCQVYLAFNDLVLHGE